MADWGKFQEGEFSQRQWARPQAIVAGTEDHEKHVVMLAAMAWRIRFGTSSNRVIVDERVVWCVHWASIRKDTRFIESMIQMVWLQWKEVTR